MVAPKESTLDGIVTAIAILVLVIGTASGNAYVMLALAIAGLASVAILGRKSFRWPVALGMGAAALLAFTVALGIAGS